MGLTLDTGCSVDINTSLCDAYIGDGGGGGVASAWVGMLGVDGDGEDGTVMQEVKQFFHNVEQDLANLEELLPNDITIQVCLLPIITEAPTIQILLFVDIWTRVRTCKSLSN